MPLNDNVKSQALRRAGGLCDCRRKEHRHLFSRCAALVTRSSADSTTNTPPVKAEGTALATAKCFAAAGILAPKSVSEGDKDTGRLCLSQT